MIPSVNTILTTDLEIQTMPSKIYRMKFDEERINGYRDKSLSVMQAVYKILNTERYQYIIYSWNYGIELADLFGEPVTYVCPELERRIREALSVDDRIESLENFDFDTSVRHQISVSFRVNTIFGDSFEAEKAVNI